MPLMAERQEKSQVLGDFLREMAVLIIVLYPLDAYLQGKFDWLTFGHASERRTARV